jgi:nickel-dependent lactate racemase
LNTLGIPDGNVDIVIGRGTHRAPTQEEIAAKLGSELVNRVRVSVHDADNKDNLVRTGTTRRGTPAWLNRIVAEADVTLGIGTINPHYFAGYSGGPKIVLPGVSGRNTLRINHVLIRDPNTVQGKMDGNPIWEDMLEAARLAKLTYLVNFVLTASKAVHQIFIGEVEATQKAAVESFKKIYGVPIAKPVDVVITSAYPLEVDLIQSGKAILSVEAVTREGGTIILSSACHDGAGPMYYETLRERPAADQVVDWIADGKASPTGGPMASRVRKLLETKKLVVVTEGLSAEKLADMEMGQAASVEEAIAKLRSEYSQANVAVLPVGGATFPYLVAQ